VPLALQYFLEDRSEMVLMMLYDTQTYWGTGLCPSYGIHRFSGTGSVSVLRLRKVDKYSVGSLRKSNFIQ
jgi:hypothetical protein